MMLCIPGNIGWSMIGSVWYQLRSGVGMWKIDGDGDCMDWSGVWDEAVDKVDSGTLTGSTCISKGGHATGAGIGGAGVSAGTGAAEGGTGGGWEMKNEGPGS
jgi:hypothetical protein